MQYKLLQDTHAQGLQAIGSLHTAVAGFAVTVALTIWAGFADNLSSLQHFTLTHLHTQAHTHTHTHVSGFAESLFIEAHRSFASETDYHMCHM